MSSVPSLSSNNQASALARAGIAHNRGVESDQLTEAKAGTSQLGSSQALGLASNLIGNKSLGQA